MLLAVEFGTFRMVVFFSYFLMAFIRTGLALGRGGISIRSLFLLLLLFYSWVVVLWIGQAKVGKEREEPWLKAICKEFWG